MALSLPQVHGETIKKYFSLILLTLNCTFLLQNNPFNILLAYITLKPI